jgi:hypothetical protein
MNMKIIILFGLAIVSSFSLMNCQTAKESKDPCDQINTLLNGEFVNPYREGRAIFKGGLEGTADIGGMDYNSMICTYVITDCETGAISMMCDNAPFNTNIIYMSKDSFELAGVLYYRKQ